MVKYYGRAKTITGSINTNQSGLNMSGVPSTVGHASSVQSYINRRVDSLAGVCGIPKQNGGSWRQSLKNKHPYCKPGVSKCLAAAGGVGHIKTPYYKTPDSGKEGCGQKGDECPVKNRDVQEYYYELNEESLMNPTKAFGNNWSGTHQMPYNIVLILTTSDIKDPNYKRNNNTLGIIENLAGEQQNTWMMNSPELPPFGRPSLTQKPFFNFYVVNWSVLLTHINNFKWSQSLPKTDIMSKLDASDVSGGYPLFIYFSPVLPTGLISVNLLDSNLPQTDHTGYPDKHSLYTLPPVIETNLKVLRQLICLSKDTKFDNTCKGNEDCNSVVDPNCFNKCIDQSCNPIPPNPLPPIALSTLNLWPAGSTNPNQMQDTLLNNKNLTVNYKPKNALIILHLLGCGECNMVLSSIKNILLSNNNVFKKFGIQPYEIVMRAEADILATKWAKLKEIPLCVPVQRSPLPNNSAYYSPLANNEAKTILNLPIFIDEHVSYEKDTTFSIGNYPQAYYYDSSGNRNNLIFDNCCFNTCGNSNQVESLDTMTSILCKTIKTSCNTCPMLYCP